MLGPNWPPTTKPKIRDQTGEQEKTLLTDPNVDPAQMYLSVPPQDPSGDMLPGAVGTGVGVGTTTAQFPNSG
jgi:hypothetical protein